MPGVPYLSPSVIILMRDSVTVPSGSLSMGTVSLLPWSGSDFAECSGSAAKTDCSLNSCNDLACACGRRGGAASALLGAAERMAGKWQQNWVLLHVYVDNFPGLRLYHRNGCALRDMPRLYSI